MPYHLVFRPRCVGPDWTALHRNNTTPACPPPLFSPTPSRPVSRGHQHPWQAPRTPVPVPCPSPTHNQPTGMPQASPVPMPCCDDCSSQPHHQLQCPPTLNDATASRPHLGPYRPVVGCRQHRQRHRHQQPRPQRLAVGGQQLGGAAQPHVVDLGRGRGREGKGRRAGRRVGTTGVCDKAGRVTWLGHETEVPIDESLGPRHATPRCSWLAGAATSLDHRTA